MKINIALFVTLMLVGSTWVGAFGSQESSLSQIVFYVILASLYGDDVEGPFHGDMFALLDEEIQQQFPPLTDRPTFVDS